MNKPVILCVLDGFGINNSVEYNAIEQASTPFLDYIFKNYPHTELATSGELVGLPEGQMGNSEVGHMTLGSGRVILQDLLRINQAIANKDLENSIELKNLITFHANQNKNVHLFGLCSDGGVHSHIEHIIFLAKLLAQSKVNVKLHLFLDGRDTAPKSATEYLTKITDLVQEYSTIEIATISGRFYAMDRDQRWDRTKLALKAIIKAEAIQINNWQDYLQTQYDNNITDEFIIPAAFDGYLGIKEQDSLLFANFRSDRIRQLAELILGSDIDLSFKIGMTNYSTELNKHLTSLFSEQIIKNNLGEILSFAGKKQLRIAETEKYAHVTFFFNCGKEDLYPGEDRKLISSPKVKTYDLQPEMSAEVVTKELTELLAKNLYDFIVLNYANCDMVGHSGDMKAAIKAVEIIDQCLKKLYIQINKNDGILIVTADHGNVEFMFDKHKNTPHTSHTLNPVPFILIGKQYLQSNLSLKKGNLSDVAPTILDLMNLKKPIEMTGKSLIEKKMEEKKKSKTEWLSLLGAILIALLIRTIVFEPYSIPSGSMKPNFLVGDYLFVSKYTYGISNASLPFEPNIFPGRIFKLADPKRGDVIVFKSSNNRYVNYIKRLIGFPGDKIQVINGILYINGKEVERKDAGTFTDTDGSVLKRYIETLPNGISYYVLDDTPNYIFDNTKVYTVPEGHYFFMGDNRDHSVDSRAEGDSIGFVPFDKFIGKAEMIIFSNPETIIEIWKWVFGFNKDRFFVKVNP